MKKVIRWLFKAATAGMTAFAIASAVCVVYYNPGIHVTNKSGETDYVWQSNQFVSKMTEGIAWGRTDKNGFYNEKCIDKNMDILIMGSSQMEGTNVFPEQKTAYLLEEMTGQTVYNIGISAHGLLTCVKNLESALTNMEPEKYVVFEIGTTQFTERMIEECLSGKMASLSSHDSGILYQLQKNPYLKLVYAQLKYWIGNDNEEDVVLYSEEKNGDNDKELFDAYKQLTQRISEICEKHKVQPLIFYHPHLELCEDGTAEPVLDEETLVMFQNACRESQVIFVDMTEDFMNMYREEHVLPHGFCNTSVGYGHLNPYGHRAIAGRLAEIVLDNVDTAEEENQ